MLAVSSTAAAAAVSQTGVSERRTGAEAARARRASSTGVPHVTASQASTIATCTAVTASVADPSENTLFGQWGPHWSSGVLSGGCSVIATPSSHSTAIAPPVSHRNRSSVRDSRCPVGWASIRYANTSGIRPVNTTPMLNSDAVARAVQQPQRRQQPDGDQQPAHPRLDLARLRVQPRRRSAPRSSRRGSRPRGPAAGQRDSPRSAARPRWPRTRRRTAIAAEPERPAASTSTAAATAGADAAERAARAGCATTGGRLGVLERSALRLAGGNLGTHDSASVPGSAFLYVGGAYER